MNLEERYKSKRDIAANLGLNPVWTVGEYKFAEKETAARIARESVEREAKSAKAIADKKASEEVRSAKIAALLQRPKAQAFTADGGKRFGIPIESEGEDEVLDMGTFCIRMQDGLPVEAYILRKNGSGRVTRENRTAVFASHAAVKAGSIDVSTEAENIPFDLDGNFGEASIFSSFAAVEEMRTKHGLNSGSIVGVRKGVEIQLYKVTKQVSKLVGTLEA
jgi:hypothetical protein